MRAIDINILDKQPVYIISGDDDYLIKKAKKAVFDLADGIMKEFNVTEYSAPTTVNNDVLKNIEYELETSPVLSDTRVVAVDLGVSKLNKDVAKNLAEIIKRHKNVNNISSVLLIVNREDANNEFVKLGELIDCKRLSVGELAPIASKMAGDRGYAIETDALRALVERSDRYLSNIQYELDKLTAYAEGKKITLSDVDDCIKEKSEYIVFEITDALGNGDNYRALRAIERIKAANNNESEGAMKILYMLISHYRRMFYGKISPLNDVELGKELGCKPYAISKARDAACSFKPMELKKILDNLQSIEMNLKRGAIATKDVVALATCAVLR